MNIKINDRNEYIIIELSFENPVEPKDILEIIKEIKNIVGNKYYGKGIIISGRMPIWLYCAITHEFHPAKFVATFDPRLQGAVIVESHDKNYKIGEIIKEGDQQWPPSFLFIEVPRG